MRIMSALVFRKPTMTLHPAIEANLIALRQIVLALVAMAGAESKTLPRHVFNAVRSLLRPAESAARRLIIAAARGIVVTLPEPRKARPERAFEDLTPRQKRLALRRKMKARQLAEFKHLRDHLRRRRAKRVIFPLLDPAYRPFRNRRCIIPDHKAPRIRSLFGPVFPYRPAPPPPPPGPSRNDPINAERLRLRIAALTAALEDIPGQALRFAKWRARVERRKATEEAKAKEQPAATAGGVRWIRDWPLRLGRPYACRLTRWDPDAPRRKKIRDIDEILARAHTLALDALDSS
jgi:hypothetical protein